MSEFLYWFIVIVSPINAVLNALLLKWALRDEDKGEIIWRSFMTVVMSVIFFYYLMNPGLANP